RPGGARASQERRPRRDRADRAAVSIPGRAEGCGRRLLPEARRGRLGAGGAPEHGPVAGDPSPPGGKPARGGQAPLHRPSLAREPQRGLPDRTPARAGPDRPRSARLAAMSLADSGQIALEGIILASIIVPLLILAAVCWVSGVRRNAMR